MKKKNPSLKVCVFTQKASLPCIIAMEGSEQRQPKGSSSQWLEPSLSFLPRASHKRFPYLSQSLYLVCVDQVSHTRTHDVDQLR